MNNYKPNGYNSVSPYLVVNGAEKMIDLLKQIFAAKELHRYETPEGSLMHAELQLDDSVVMLAESSERYPPNKLLLHVYVADVDATFNKAISAGCKSIQEPKRQEGDPDKRGMFEDFSGNTWAVGTQM